MNLFIKEKKIQLLPFVFNSVDGSAFRKEKCLFNNQEKKIEFFFLKQSSYNSFFLNMNQYVVWTYLNGIFRVLIHEEYYYKFNVLYQKEINSFYIKFIYELLNKRIKIIKKNFFYLAIGLTTSLVFSFLVNKVLRLISYKVVILFSLPIVLFLIFFIFFLKKNNNKFQIDKKKLFSQFIKESEIFLGKEKLESILEKHRFYRHVSEKE